MQQEDLNAAKSAFVNLRVYGLAEKLADELWCTVLEWKPLARSTVGIQLIRAADSIGANIAEGAGRGTYKDNRRFVTMARGSLNETLHWLRRPYVRQLLNKRQVEQAQALTAELAPRLNAYLKSIGRKGPRSKGNEPPATDN